MKILLISPYLPWPLDAGGKYAQYTMIEQLRKEHSVTLVCNGLPWSAAKALQAKWPDVKLVLVTPAQRSLFGKVVSAMYDSVWILKDRATELLPALVGPLQKKVRNARKTKQNGSDGLVAIPDVPADFAQAVMQEVKQGYDMIQVDFVDCLGLIDILPADVPRVFVHHQLHFVFHERLFGDKLKEDPAMQRRFAALKEKEIALLRRYDALIAFTDVDVSLLVEATQGPPVYCSPFGIREGKARPDTGEFNGNIVYVGSEFHYPNLDGVNWFLAKVWPEVVKAKPDLQFHIIGLWSEATIERLETFPNVRCRGFVPELEPVLWDALMVVPLWIGSGIRTKILQAMMQGTPVISTSVGCEGIPARDGSEILVRDTPEGFAEAILRLAGSGENRLMLAGNARKMVEERFSARAAAKMREEAYEAIRAAWKAKREEGAPGPGAAAGAGLGWKIDKPASYSL